ncbi:MAG: SDR family oxidoreductase [Candidatus Omnitrophica bacterium]|nr:SDR family oxidoreductase [Candidatus Omnitrophota bacterium]
MRKAVVTGGAGFIGSHLTELLLNNGYRVLVIDNFSTGRRENLQHLRNNSSLSIMEADVNDIKEIKPFFKDVDFVFHLAALADIVPSIVNPLGYHKSNVDGTISVLEIIREVCPGIKKFVYTASSSCYGSPDKYPTLETAEIRPQYPYALTKYLGELITLHWGRIYKLPVASLRLFNVYGPRSRTSGTYGAVFGVFLAQKLASKPFTVVGDGKQTRDFTFVSDAAEAFMAAAESDCKDEIFNVGSGDTYSVNRLVELLKGPVIHISKRPGEPDCTWADIGKIRSMLGWRPKVSFEEGVNKMIERIDYWKRAPVWTPQTIEKATGDWFKYLTKG